MSRKGVPTWAIAHGGPRGRLSFRPREAGRTGEISKTGGETVQLGLGLELGQNPVGLNPIKITQLVSRPTEVQVLLLF